MGLGEKRTKIREKPTKNEKKNFFCEKRTKNRFC
jgi:hypothetical protein